MEYPIMLYKADGSMLEWDGAMWDYVICNDEDEYGEAVASGFSLTGVPEKAAKKKAAE